MSRQRRLARQRRLSCALCGAGDASYVGVYVPDPATNRLIGAAAGTQRLVAYRLCGACFELSDVADRVRDEIIGDLASPERN